MTGLEVGLAEQLITAFLLAGARTAAFVLVTPPFSTRNISGRARGGVAIALALPLAPLMQAGAPALASWSLVVRALTEALTGATLGFFVLMAVATIQSVGELLDIVGGFTVTAALDPLLMAQSSVMGRLHQLTAVTVLFVSDGHLVVLHGLARTVTPAPMMLNWSSVASALTHDLAHLFSAAVQIAAPVIAAMLVADVALGLLTRAAPALNPFSLGFPLKILFTLLLAGLVIVRLPEALASGFEAAVLRTVDLVREVTGGGG